MTTVHNKATCRNCGEPITPRDNGTCRTCWELHLRSVGWVFPIRVGQVRGEDDPEARAEYERRGGREP